MISLRMSLLHISPEAPPPPPTTTTTTTTTTPQVEEHMVDGQLKTLLVHRKGSTRAFPPHHPLIPVDYQLTGQPVLIGGTMGTCSYVLTGAWAAAGWGGLQMGGGGLEWRQRLSGLWVE